MISNFASESDKKAGEFYTLQEVSMLMVMVVMDGKKGIKGYTVYDPTMGFCVIIKTQSDRQVNTRVLEFLPKFKIKRWIVHVLFRYVLLK